MLATSRLTIVPISAIVLSLLPVFHPVLATSASANNSLADPAFTYNVIFWTSSGCCGGAVGLNRQQGNECLYISPGLPSSIGRSMAVTGGAFGVGNQAPSTDPFQYGYGVAYTGTNCNGTVLGELRLPRCYAFLDPRARSFMFKLTTKAKRSRLGEKVGLLLEEGMANVDDAEDGVVEVAERPEQHKGPDFFQYQDKRSGRSRRIMVNGDGDITARVSELYAKGDFDALAEFEEIW